MKSEATSACWSPEFLSRTLVAVLPPQDEPNPLAFASGMNSMTCSNLAQNMKRRYQVGLVTTVVPITRRRYSPHGSANFRLSDLFAQ